MGKVIIILTVLVLAGCAATAPPEVKIPVPVSCPAPPAVRRPHLPIADLSPKSAPNAVERAYAASLTALMGYAQQLERLLDGYRPQKGQR